MWRNPGSTWTPSEIPHFSCKHTMGITASQTTVDGRWLSANKARQWDRIGVYLPSLGTIQRNFRFIKCGGAMRRMAVHLHCVYDASEFVLGWCSNHHQRTSLTRDRSFKASALLEFCRGAGVVSGWSESPRAPDVNTAVSLCHVQGDNHIGPEVFDRLPWK